MRSFKRLGFVSVLFCLHLVARVDEFVVFLAQVLVRLHHGVELRFDSGRQDKIKIY